MPDNAPFPALPTPRGVLQASMIRASAMANSSLMMGRFELWSVRCQPNLDVPYRLMNAS
jgi:hypothetical protein